MRRGWQAELLAEVGAQPAQGEREARPGRRAQHVRQHPQVESEGGLAAQARCHVRQAARGLRVLPGPLELRAGVRASEPPREGPTPQPIVLPPRLLPYPKGGHGGREAVHYEHHLPGEENEGGVRKTPPSRPTRVKPNPLATVRLQSSQRASSLVHEALPLLRGPSLASPTSAPPPATGT